MEEFKFTLDPEKFKKSVQEKLNEEQSEEQISESQEDLTSSSQTETENNIPDVVVFEDEFVEESLEENEETDVLEIKRQKREEKQRKKEQKKAEKREKNKHKGNNILFYIAFVLLILIIGVILSLTVLFNVETVTVEDSTIYTSDEILKASGITLGENVFFISSQTIEENICRLLPYIKSVDVQKRLDNKIILKVQETYDYMVVSNSGGFAIISPEKKVLRFTENSYPNNLIHVFGLSVTNVYPGEKAVFKQENAVKALDTLVPVLIETGFDRVNSINVNDLSAIKFVFDRRICVNVGTQDNLEYKLSFAKQAIEVSIEEDATGTLNLSQLSSKNREIQFRKEMLYDVKQIKVENKEENE